MDSRSSYRNDSNDNKIVKGDRRAAENVFLGYGVQAVTLIQKGDNYLMYLVIGGYYLLLWYSTHI